MRQGAFVNQPAARGIDEEGGGLHAPEEFRIDHSRVACGELAVQREDIGPGRHFVERRQVFPTRGIGGAGHQHTHPEGAADVRDAAGDAPAADESEAKPIQFGEVRQGCAPLAGGGPMSARHGRGVRPDAVAEFEDEGEDVLRDGCRAIGWHIADSDPAGAGGGDVHHIVARGQHADKAERGQSGDGFRGERRFVGQHYGCTGGARDHIARCGGRINFQPPKRSHVAPVQVAVQ